MAAKGGKESNQGLVIVLVFFILATIGLGVGTYYGFADQDKLKADKKKADGDRKKADDERDFYRFEANLLRAYLGIPVEGKALEELAQNKAKFDSNQFGGGLSDERKKELEELRSKLVKDTFEGKRAMAWDANKNQPVITYEAMLDGALARVKQLEDSLKTAEAERAKAEKKAADAEDLQKKDRLSFEAELAKRKTEHEDSIKSYQATIKKLNEDFDAASKKKDPEKQNLLEEKEKIRKEKLVLEKEMKDLKDKMDVLESKLARREEMKPIDIKPRGQIVAVHGSGNKAYINLGSASGVKPQVTFSVFGLAPNGKPKERSKGSVEVVNVINERMSEVVITRMYDPEDKGDVVTGRRTPIEIKSAKNVDPIVKGDVLINPAWKPDEKTHIAITGVVDLQRGGYDNIQVFMRALEKQNIILDAYLDTRDMSIKGPGITHKTDFLIIGNQPSSLDPSPEAQKRALEISKKMEEMRLQALKYGVTNIKLSKFLDETGYRLMKRIEH